MAKHIIVILIILYFIYFAPPRWKMHAIINITDEEIHLNAATERQSVSERATEGGVRSFLTRLLNFYENIVHAVHTELLLK